MPRTPRQQVARKRKAGSISPNDKVRKTFYGVSMNLFLDPESIDFGESVIVPWKTDNKDVFQLWRATVAGKTDSHILLHYEDGENHQHAMNESLYLVAFDDHELFKEELGRNLSQHTWVSCW